MEKEKEPVTQTEEKTEESVTQTDNKTEDKVDVKTFTQEEVNAMIKKETDKATKKYKDIDLKAYNEWQESQKTETEKQNDFYDNLRNIPAESFEKGSDAMNEIAKKYRLYLTDLTEK